MYFYIWIVFNISIAFKSDLFLFVSKKVCEIYFSILDMFGSQYFFITLTFLTEISVVIRVYTSSKFYLELFVHVGL